MINNFLRKYVSRKIKSDDIFLPFESLREKYDVIIHIGSPKSGTSALQNFFHHNRAQLLTKGIHYPEHGLDKNGVSGGHSKLAIALMENRLDDAQMLFNSWYKHAENTNNLLLLSSEAFFNLGQKMKPLLKNKNVLIMAYHRDPVEYLVSAHNQLVKRHFGIQNFTKYSESILSNENKTANLINKSFIKIYVEWEALVGKENLIVRSYQKESFIEGKIEKDFISRMGLEFKGFKEQSKRINKSYTEDALEIKRMINFVLDKESTLNHKIDLALQKYSEEHNLNTSIIYDELNSKLKSFFEEDEKLIQNKYLENYVYVKKNNSPEQIRTERESIDTDALQKVVDCLIKDDEIKNYLLGETLKILKLGHTNYSVFKLAELLNIENLEEYDFNDHWFNANQLKMMTEGKYKEADFLRDIASLLKDRKNYNDAEKIIQQALKLRPKGPAIIKLDELIQKCL